MLLCAAGTRNQGEPSVNDLLAISDAREMKSKLFSKTVVVKDHKLVDFYLQCKKRNEQKPCCQTAYKQSPKAYPVLSHKRVQNAK